MSLNARDLLQLDPISLAAELTLAPRTSISALLHAYSTGVKLLVPRSRVIRDALHLFGATVFAQFFRLPAGILARAILGPATIGIFMTYEVITSYSVHTNLGVSRAAMREVPYELGRGATGQARLIHSTALSFGIISGIFSAVVVLIVALLLYREWSEVVLLGMFGYSLAAFFGQLAMFHSMMAIAYQWFNDVSRITLLGGIVHALGVITLVPIFGAIGFLLVASGRPAIEIAAYRISAHHKERVPIMLPSWKALHNLARIGFPFATAGLVLTTILGIDRLLIAGMLGLHAAGVYSIAALAKGHLRMVQGSLHSALHPRFQRAYGKDPRPATILPLFKEALTVLGLSFPLILAGFHTSLLVLVAAFLPRFQDGVKPLAAIMLSMQFLMLQTIAGLFNETVKKQDQQAVLSIIAALITTSLTTATIVMGYGLEGVGFATAFSYGIYYWVSVGFALRQTEGWMEALKSMAVTTGTALYAYGLWLLFESVFPWGVQAWTQIVGNGALRFLGFCICWSPMIIVLWKRLIALAYGHSPFTMSSQAV